jgi:hypothetical protein
VQGLERVVAVRVRVSQLGCICTLEALHFSNKVGFAAQGGCIVLKVD